MQIFVLRLLLFFWLFFTRCIINQMTNPVCGVFVKIIHSQETDVTHLYSRKERFSTSYPAWTSNIQIQWVLCVDLELKGPVLCWKVECVCSYLKRLWKYILFIDLGGSLLHKHTCLCFTLCTHKLKLIFWVWNTAATAYHPVFLNSISVIKHLLLCAVILLNHFKFLITGLLIHTTWYLNNNWLLFLVLPKWSWKG